MQHSPYEEIAASAPFRYIVGKGEKVLYVHAALISRKSKPLERFVAVAAARQQDYLILADDEVTTLAAFIEYLYRDDYDLPLPLPLSSSSNEDKQSTERAAPSKEWPRPSDKYWGAFTRTTLLFRRRAHLDVAPLPTTCLGTDYSEFFKAHARIFIFAEYYAVADLAEMALEKIHGALCALRLSQERFEDVLALVRFCYDADRPAQEKLKKLLTGYLASALNWQMHARLHDVLREKGDFAADMALALAARVTKPAEFTTFI